VLTNKIVGSNDARSVHSHTREGDTGLLVFTDVHIRGEITAVPFFNPTYGADLNQIVTFAGTPEGIHNGGDAALWTAAAGSGTWNFADTTAPQAGLNHISITGADDLDFATFSDATETNMANYTAITGQVRLEAYNGALNTVLIKMRNNGSDVGVAVNLNNYITTSQLGVYQSIVIPKADLGLNGDTIDEMVITLTRSGGAKPIVYFDEIQIEETGDSLRYTVVPAAGTVLHVTQVVFTVADTGTAGAAYAYNKIGAISTLANGIVFNAVSVGENLFSSTIKQNSDFLNAAGEISNKIDDGVNTFYTVNVDVGAAQTVRLDSREEDSLSVVINDDLSGLDLFTAVAVGWKETIADR